MKATIDGVDYRVRFQHLTLPFHNNRTMPTVDDAIPLLSMAAMELQEPGSIANVPDAIRAFVGRYVGASASISHRTGCFILSDDRRASWESRIVSSGFAFCDKRDQFDRSTGRWLAFKTAIAAFPKAAQSEWIWWLLASPMRLPLGSKDFIEYIAAA
jgi:hypothetical protein